MRELNRLIKLCEEMNYNLFIQFYAGDFNVSVDDNNVQIDKEIACAGGYDNIKEPIIEILKIIDK